MWNMSDEVYGGVKVVAAIKQPMEADVSGGTAEAVFEREEHYHFLLEMLPILQIS